MCLGVWPYTLGSNERIVVHWLCACVCMCVSVCVCVRVCFFIGRDCSSRLTKVVCVCVYVCVRACLPVCVFWCLFLLLALGSGEGGGEAAPPDQGRGKGRRGFASTGERFYRHTPLFIICMPACCVPPPPPLFLHPS